MQASSNRPETNLDIAPPLSIGISASAREHAQRHYQRALEQVKLKKPNLAIQELRDAVKIDPTNSSYHALLGKIHLDRGMTGMANISIREALKIDPENELAQECLKKLGAKVATQAQKSSISLMERMLSLMTKKL